MFCIILSISGTSMYPAMVARHVIKTQNEIINGAQVWRNLGNSIGGMIKYIVRRLNVIVYVKCIDTGPL